MPAATTAADQRPPRRLPRLQSRPRRPTPEMPDNTSSDDDQPLALTRSRSPRKRSSAERTKAVGSSSSSPTDHGGSSRRFTAAEKGKGRAAPPSPTPIEIESDSDDDSPLLADESIQFIKLQPPSPLPVEDEVESVIGEEDAITAYNCPVCFSAPTAPALTPCGHVLCYSCLHSSLLAAIGRQQNPYVLPQPIRGGRGRGRGRGGRGSRGGHQVQLAEWDTDSLREAVTTQADAMLRHQIEANGTVGEDAEAIFNVQREERGEAQIEHPLKGLWQVQGSWVIEGECPVCRERIPGGLGPIGSGVGGVILLEARVRHAGDLA